MVFARNFGKCLWGNSVEFHLKWIEAAISLEVIPLWTFLAQSAVLTARELPPAQRRKPAGDSQTFYFLNEAAWLRRKRGISLHFLPVTTGNHEHAYTRLDDCKLLLKQHRRNLLRLISGQSEDRDESNHSPTGAFPLVDISIDELLLISWLEQDSHRSHVVNTRDHVHHIVTGCNPARPTILKMRVLRHKLNV